MAWQRGSKWHVKYRELYTGKEKTQSFNTKEEAELWQAQRKYDRKHSPEKLEPTQKKHRTFNDVAREYYERKGVEMQAATKKMDTYHYNIALFPILAEIRIDRLTGDDIDKVIMAEQRRGMAPGTINRRLDIARAIIRFALKKKYIKEEIEVPKLRNRPTEIKPPTEEEALALYEHAQGHVKRFVLLACATGIRLGPREFFPITWADVDFHRKEIYVESAKKGGLKARYVPIRKDLLPVMLQWFEEDGRNLSMTVINWKGKPIKAIKSAWKSLKKKCGITRKMRPYDLRHFFATFTLGQGADLKAVADILGHHPSMTLDKYQHVINRAKTGGGELSTKSAESGMCYI